MRANSDRKSTRWYQDKWILDRFAGLLGPVPLTSGALSGTYEAVGRDISVEADTLNAKVKKFADIKRETLKIARNRESAGRAAEKANHPITTREHFFVASLMYGSARWPIWEEDNEEMIQLDDKMVELYDEYIDRAPYRIDRVKIPFEGKIIYGLLHLPPTSNDKIPCLVAVPGMDTFKEQAVSMYGDKVLQRGIAVLALDGPGQGETCVKGLKVTVDNYDRAGRVVMDYLKTREEIDGEKVALRGRSFGSYWCPRIIANDDRYIAGAVQAVCHEPEMRSLFESAKPTFKLRQMWMTGIYDENEFYEKYASKLTLRGVGERIRCPFLILAGEDDELSPIEYTYEFYSTLAGPKKLMVFEDEGHGINKHPNNANVIADFVQDAIERKSISSERLFIESSGTIVNR